MTLLQYRTVVRIQVVQYISGYGTGLIALLMDIAAAIAAYAVLAKAMENKHIILNI